MALIRYFVVRDFEVVAFLPITYNNTVNVNITNAHVLLVNNFMFAVRAANTV